MIPINQTKKVACAEGGSCWVEDGCVRHGLFGSTGLKVAFAKDGTREARGRSRPHVASWAGGCVRHGPMLLGVKTCGRAGRGRLRVVMINVQKNEDHVTGRPAS